MLALTFFPCQLGHLSPLVMTRRRQIGSEPPADRAGRPRLLDVAAAAGVSTMTVTRVLRDPEKVAAVTRERVQRVLTETGYTPDLLARGLASNRSGLDRRGDSGAHQFADRRDHAGSDRRAGAGGIPPAARCKRFFGGGGGSARARVSVASHRWHLSHRRDPYRRDRPHAQARRHPGRRGWQSHGETDRHGGRLLERRGGARGHAPLIGAASARSATSALIRATTTARAIAVGGTSWR